MVDARYRILSTGYNGPPSKFPHCIDTPCAGVSGAPGDTSKCIAIHAEQNAIMQCHSLDSVHAIYISATPCFVCARMLCNLQSLERIVACEWYMGDAAAVDLLLQWKAIKPGRSVYVEVTNSSH